MEAPIDENNLFSQCYQNIYMCVKKKFIYCYPSGARFFYLRFLLCYSDEYLEDPIPTALFFIK